MDNIETSQPQSSAQGHKRSYKSPSHSEKTFKICGIEKNCRSNPKTYNICKTVIFNTETAACPKTSCNLTIHKIKEDCNKYQPPCRNNPTLKHKYNRKHATEQVTAGYHIRCNIPKGNFHMMLFRDFHHLPLQSQWNLHSHAVPFLQGDSPIKA